MQVTLACRQMILKITVEYILRCDLIVQVTLCLQRYDFVLVVGFNSIVVRR